MLSKMARPSSTALTMLAKLSSVKIMSAASRGHRCRPCPWRCDVGGLERRRVVDAVASHRHDLAHRLERLSDAHLVFGTDAGEDDLADERFLEASSSIVSRSAPVMTCASAARQMPILRAMASAVRP